MFTMILRRIFLGLATISIVSLIIFAGVEILPEIRNRQQIEVQKIVLEATHPILFAIVEECRVKPKCIVRMRLRKL